MSDSKSNWPYDVEPDGSDLFEKEIDWKPMHESGSANLKSVETLAAYLDVPV